MEHLPRKTTGGEQRHPKREAMWAAISNAVGMGLGLLEFTFPGNLPWLLDPETQDIMSVLLGFGLILV